MALETYTITNFGGLNEVDPPDDIGIENATALQDVTWDQSTGSLRQRDGYAAFLDSAEAATFVQPVHRYPRSNQYLGCHLTSNTLEVYDSGGATVASTNIGSDLALSYADLGTPSASYTYASRGSTTTISSATNGPPMRWDGSAFSSRTSLPYALYVATQPNDNRLVAAATPSATGGPSGAASSTSHVWFSDAGDPETFGANNYVILTPGDGESIRGMTVWNNQLFVFKDTKLFIFYGNSVDSAGNPIFNYRTVELRDPLSATLAPIVASAPEGVYFLGRYGIYLTTGDAPIRISDALDYGPTATYPSISYARERLFCSTLSSGCHVWDARVQEWTKWDLDLQTTVCETRDSTDLGLFGSSAGSQLYQLLEGQTTDAGSNISSQWTSGLSNLGYESEKRLKYIDVWGTGTVSLSVASNFASPANATTLTLGSSTIDRTRYTTAAVGHLFGIKLASVSGAAWKVNRITLHFDPAPTGQHDRT